MGSWREMILLLSPFGAVRASGGRELFGSISELCVCTDCGVFSLACACVHSRVHVRGKAVWLGVRAVSEREG